MLDYAAPEEHLADLIYEAAFDPDRWEDVIDGICARSGADCGAVTTYREAVPTGARLTGECKKVTEFELPSLTDMLSRRSAYFAANPIGGFFPHASYFPATLGQDPVAEIARVLGIAHQVGMIVPVGPGEMAIFCVHRPTSSGPFSREQIAVLDGYRRHLGRAALIATRLGLERAHAAASTLNALGVPAAVLSNSGRLRASNQLFDTLPEIIAPLAFGGVAIRHATANRLFQDAVAEAAGGRHAAVRSIPVPAPDGGAPFVLHLLPLRRVAHDIFGGADALVAVTRVGAAKNAPAPALLMGLFDLTPAEVKLACALAEGHTLQAAAKRCGIQRSTARAYLDCVFRKTGTHRQSELVLLLCSAQPPV